MCTQYRCYPGMPVYDEEKPSTWGAYRAQLEYLQWMANEAHARGLAIALKNNLEQVCGRFYFPSICAAVPHCTSSEAPGF